MNGVLRIAGSLGAAIVLLANAACFAACAVESCQQQTRRAPCHKHKPAKSATDSGCFARTVIAPIPADAPLEPPAETDMAGVLEAPVLDAPVLAIDAARTPDPPGPPLILRV